MCEINASYDTNTEGSAEGTVFPSTIRNTHINTLFDTGASRSVMSGDMYRKLKLENFGLDRITQSSRSGWYESRSDGKSKM